jgi:hypothetical protein
VDLPKILPEHGGMSHVGTGLVEVVAAAMIVGAMAILRVRIPAVATCWCPGRDGSPWLVEYTQDCAIRSISVSTLDIELLVPWNVCIGSSRWLKIGSSLHKSQAVRLGAKEY